MNESKIDRYEIKNSFLKTSSFTGKKTFIWVKICSKLIFIIGNAMAFAGVPNAKDRGDLVAYLKESKWRLMLINFTLDLT